MNTCYSLVAPDYGISIAAVYRVVEDKIVVVEGSEGTSPIDAPDEIRVAKQSMRSHGTPTSQPTSSHEPGMLHRW